MSSYYAITKRPYGDERWDVAYWIDDYFGRHRYGIMFSDGVILKDTEHDLTRIDTMDPAAIARAYLKLKLIDTGDKLKEFLNQ